MADKIENSLFIYTGIAKNGKPIKGEVEARSIESAKIAIVREGVKVTSLKKKTASLFQRKEAISSQDISIAFRQIATMLKAGVTIVQALSIIALGSTNRELQRVLLEIKASIEGGSQLSRALEKHPKLFDQLSISLIAAGEKSGTLDALIDKLAVYKEKGESLKKKIKKATGYPKAVIMIAVVVTIVMLIWVVPAFVGIFEGFGKELPVFTQLIVDGSDALIENWLQIIIVVAGIYFGSKFLYNSSPALREKIEELYLHIPIVKNVVRGSAIARFSRTLGTMFAAGVPLVESLGDVALATGNTVYEKAVLTMAQEISQGDPMHTSMKKYRHLFDELAIQLIQIGEESGSLESMLYKIADYYEEEVDAIVDSLASLMEPFIIVILGVLVGGLVVGMYLPIFQLGDAIG